MFVQTDCKADSDSVHVADTFIRSRQVLMLFTVGNSAVLCVCVCVCMYRIFSVLSAILYLGNITYTLSEDGQVLEAGPADVLSTLSDLLKVSSAAVFSTVRLIYKSRSVFLHICLHLFYL